MTSYEEFKKELMIDPKFRKEYEVLEPKYKAIQGGLDVINLAIECGVLCPRDEAFKYNCTACKLFWKAWEEQNERS